MNLGRYIKLLPAGLMGIVDEAAMLRIKKLGSVFSQVPSGEFIFESTLLSPQTTADFSFKVEHSGAKLLLQALENGCLNDWVTENHSYQYVRKFVKLWTEDPMIGSRVKDFWFEFDDQVLAMTPAVPCVFFDAETIQARASNGWAYGRVLPALTGSRMEEAIIRRLEDCVSALPHGSWLFQLGAMLSRGNTQSIRLFTSEMSKEEILPFLHMVGWRCNDTSLKTFLEWIDTFSDGQYIIDFDVYTEGISDKLGVNFGLRDYQQLDLFLQELCVRSLARDDKCAAVLAWLENTNHTIPEIQWDISHFKFPFLENCLGAKAYLRHAAVTVMQTPLANACW